MAIFCKNEACPPSEELVAFLNGDIPVSESRHIRTHVAECEFCAAELDFYERYPQPDEPIEIESPEMPRPLFELAEAIIGRRDDAGMLEHLFRSDKRR